MSARSSLLPAEAPYSSPGTQEGPGGCAYGKPDQLIIDATHLKAHRTAASLLKKGLFPDVSAEPRPHAFMSAIALAAIVIFWINQS